MGPGDPSGGHEGRMNVALPAHQRANAMKLPRREFLPVAAGAVALLAVSQSAWTQAYPTRPVRAVVAFAPGDYARWLSDEPDPRELMRVFPASLMRMWPISTRVNKPENDDPSILIELGTEAA